jgi:hypothetical protein
VGKTGEGVIVVGRRPIVPCTRWGGLIQGTTVSKNVEVIHVVITPDLRVGVFVVVAGAVVVSSVAFSSHVMPRVLVGAGGGGVGKVSGARNVTSLVLEDDAVRTVS